MSKIKTIEVWSNDEDGDTMRVERYVDSRKVYGCGNDFDFNAASYKEAKRKLTGWGYRLIGWE